jgi:sortase A
METPRVKRVLIALALIAIAASAWIHVQAQLAQVLLRVAWHRQTKPWPWADTHPVARMIVGDDDLIVLEGSNGRALAFAPGHLEHTAMPGERGNCVISAHRDTHFSALRDVRAGDVIRVQRTDGRWVEYIVAEQRVVDKRDVWVTRSSGETTLTLVTCYPFDAIVAGGPQRYVLTARAAAAVRNVSARPPMFHVSNPSTSFPSRTTAHDIPRMSMRAPVGGMPNSSP